MLVGAVAIAFSGILFRVSHVSPSTGAFYRCVWALPPLCALARVEDRRFGKRDRRSVGLAWVAGAFFAVDLILWHNAIEQVGAGLATVLGNVQVVLVGLLAWVLLGERPQRSSLTAIPVVGIGVVVLGWLLISTSLPRLPAVVTSILLTLQPVCSVVFAALIIDESPSLLQLAGAACILAGLVTATVGRRSVPAPEPELAG